MTRVTELDQVRQSGKRFRTEHLEARAIASLFPYCRAAVIVGKHGHTVIARNKLRRRLRELSRTIVIPECHGLDLVIRAFPQAYEARYDTLKGEVQEIKARLLSIEV